MSKFIGGRGKKAPYKTVVKRIPQPLEDEVEELVVKYLNTINSITDCNYDNIIISKDDLIDKIKIILRSKMSAKKSMIKLLQVLYDTNDTNFFD